MNQEFLALARRLEQAQARQNNRFNQVAGGLSLPLGGGFAHWRGEAHPQNQALGLVDPIAPEDLEQAERMLGRGGGPVVLELSPAADPALWALLARRGYGLREFQQLWVLDLARAGSPRVRPGVHRAESGQWDVLKRVVEAGFQDRDDWREQERPAGWKPMPGVSRFLAQEEDEPAGGGTLGVVDGVALLSGDSVLPRFRGRGIQKSLIAARVEAARAAGCDLACASTLPGTFSQRAYEASGFRVAYPKVEMVRDPA
jgi:GNAT superfamily N-acetyltransferase